MPSQSNGWGGPRPGAGRRKRNGVNGQHQGNAQSGFSSPPPVTFGQALENLRQAGPQPGAQPHPLNTGQSTPATTIAPDNAGGPPAGVTRQENQSFAKLVAYVGTNVGVLAIRDSLKKSGLEPHEPDPDDVERTTDATADAIARALGDAEIPWWGTLVAAWGSLYLSMRLGARPIKVDQLAPTANDNAGQAAAAAANDNAPAPVLGQGVPATRPKAGSSAYQVLPEVTAPPQ